jgi:hypothetical protein
LSFFAGTHYYSKEQTAILIYLIAYQLNIGEEGLLSISRPFQRTQKQR